MTMGGPSGPFRIGDLLARLRLPALRKDASRWADAWGEVVGPEAAERTRVRSLAGGKLIVEVFSHPLYAELRAWGAQTLREKCQRAFGREIREVRFEVAAEGA